VLRLSFVTLASFAVSLVRNDFVSFVFEILATLAELHVG
jgi:hypothetical protein